MRGPGSCRAALGCWAGGWRLAPGLGWESDWAPPAPGAGRAERGPDVSAGGFVSPQQGPNPQQACPSGSAKQEAPPRTP